MSTGIFTGIIVIVVFVFLRFRSGSAPKIKSVDSPTLKEMQKNQKVVLIDVRTPKETTTGKINSKALEANVMALDFKQKVENLDKDATYVVYCRSGQRSRRACSIMENAGFKEVYNLDGGIMGWDA